MLTARLIAGQSTSVELNGKAYVAWHFRSATSTFEVYAIFDPATGMQLTRPRRSPLSGGVLQLIGEVEYAHDRYPPAFVRYDPESLSETPFIETSVGARSPVRKWRRLLPPWRRVRS